jgi:hypothetical protein
MMATGVASARRIYRNPTLRQIIQMQVLDVIVKTVGATSGIVGLVQGMMTNRGRTTKIGTVLSVRGTVKLTDSSELCWSKLVAFIFMNHEFDIFCDCINFFNAMSIYAWCY